MSTQTPSSIEERITRAESEEMEAELVAYNPLVVEVENHEGTSDGDSIYTVIPQKQYCGCWDARARDVICKHLIFVAGLDNVVGETTRDVLTNRMKRLQSDLGQLRQAVEDTEQESEQLRRVRRSLDVESTVEADDDGDASDPDEGEVETDTNEDESGSSFRDLVSDLTSGS